jgi:allophanate hydrolase subunit 2
MNYLWNQGMLPFSPAPGFPMPGFPTPFDPWGAAQITPEKELEFLQAEARSVQSELEAILNRIKELEKERGKK